MRNKSVTTASSGFAGWMDGFFNGLSKKVANEEVVQPEETEEVLEKDEVANEEEMVSVAEVNINDLQKVTWNDETFYVNFDEQGATVLNEFGNAVTTLKGAMSLEDVDRELNSRQVVTSDFDSELKKVVADDQMDDTMDSTDTSDTPADGSTDTTQTQTFEPIQGPEDQTQTASIANDELTEVIASGFNELESKFAAMEEQYNQLAQQYARIQEVLNLDTGAAIEEQKHYEETAQATQTSIQEDQSHDLTTPQGRVELSQGQEEVSIDVPVAVEPGQDVPEAQPEDNQAPKETETPEETEDATSKEIPVQENETPADNIEDKVDSEIQVKDIKETENSEKSEEDKGVTVASLDEKDSKIFKNAVCPSCGEKQLTLAEVVDNIQGIQCKGCNSEYAVNLDTEEIFKHIVKS